jgi:hypothetical protein
MITFFACPKPFQGHINIIQRNAIKSWSLLRPKPEIILVGMDSGVAEACEEFGLMHIAEIDRNEYGTPLVNSIFQVAQEKAAYPIVCYINSDIILLSDFTQTVQTVAAKIPKFLVLGQRTDIDIQEAWNFDATDWEADFKNLLLQRGTLHAPTGIDYFCFPRGMYTDIPPFAIGRLKWDNWLVWRARSQGFPIVDITETVSVAHQNHGYAVDSFRKLDARSIEGQNHRRVWKNISLSHDTWVDLGTEAQRNIALVPEDQNLNIWAATWTIDRKGRLRRYPLRLTPAYLYYQLKSVVPLYWPAFGRAFRWVVSLAKGLLRYFDRIKLFATPKKP